MVWVDSLVMTPRRPSLPARLVALKVTERDIRRAGACSRRSTEPHSRRKADFCCAERRKANTQRYLLLLVIIAQQCYARAEFTVSNLITRKGTRQFSTFW